MIAPQKKEPYGEDMDVHKDVQKSGTALTHHCRIAIVSLSVKQNGGQACVLQNHVNILSWINYITCKELQAGFEREGTAKMRSTAQTIEKPVRTSKG